jgi:hypothetical protein
MRTATLPSRLHTLRAFLWRAHNLRKGEGSARGNDSANLTRTSHDYMMNQLTCTHFANVIPYSTQIFKSSYIVSTKLPPDILLLSCNKEFVLIKESTVAFYSCSDDRLMFSERGGSSCISAACTPSCLRTNWIKEYLTNIRHLFPATYKQWQGTECERCTGI